MNSYLQFVRGALDILLERQSARLGGQPDGAICLTGSDLIHKSYLARGRKEDGKYRTYWFPEKPMEIQPTRLDMDLWSILDSLSDLTGERRYREMVTAMSEMFGRHGFDARSGLGYLGEMCDFDVVGLAPLPRGPFTEPWFKPRNSGDCPTLPLDRLWTHAAQPMARMCRAMFYGLVTDPATMDFNRYCPYQFDDSDRKPAQPQNSKHVAFESVGARMIHWWASCWAHAGDGECLDWAQRMADKWRAVQHPDSGLVPNHFGGIASNPGGPMPPGEWCEPRNAVLAAVAWLEAAEECKKRSGGEALGAQLTAMAAKLADGLARFSYAPAQSIFLEHLHLDGQPYRGMSGTTFRTQADKDAAVRLQPDLEGVAVFAGAGFYRPPPFWSHCAGTDIPFHLAQVAARTKQADLLRRLCAMASDIRDEAGKLQGEFTEDNCWTFRANAQYIKMFLLLAQPTRERAYLDHARALADSTLRFLAEVSGREWWRMLERNSLLNALLLLHKESSRE